MESESAKKNAAAAIRSIITSAKKLVKAEEAIRQIRSEDVSDLEEIEHDQ